MQGLSQYLDGISRHPLLTATQEIELARQIQKWIALKAEKPNDADYSKEEKLIARRGKRAQDKMVRCNLRLVVNIAKKYQRQVNHMNLLDLIQEGNFGLIRATELYDPERGYKFSTYGYWWIRQAVTRSITQMDRTIRVPLHTHETLAKIRREVSHHSAIHGQVPNVYEIAEKIGVTPSRISDVLAIGIDAVSLDEKCNVAEDSSHLGEIIADPDTWLDVESIDNDKDTLARFISTLPEEEQEIIKRYYGLDGEEKVSLQAIAKDKGVSRERIRQRKDNVEKKLKRAFGVLPIKKHGGRRTSTKQNSSCDVHYISDTMAA